MSICFLVIRLNMGFWGHFSNIVTTGKFQIKKIIVHDIKVQYYQTLIMEFNRDRLREQEVKVWIEPEDKITFVCSKNIILGIIKIHLEGTHLRKHFQFQIKSTNKQQYKVSEPSGFIRKSPKTIYVYLRRINSLEKTLKDKFKVTVIDNRKYKTIFSTKLGVSIQSNLSFQNEDSFTHFSSTNFSKMESLLSNSSLLIQSNTTRKETSQLRLANVGERVKKEKESKKSQMSLKDKLSQSIQVLEKKKHKEQKLQQQIKSRKAKARFFIYLAILVVILSFLGGIYLKRLFNSETVLEMGSKIQQGISTIFS